jgi:tight adherence protein C
MDLLAFADWITTPSNLFAVIAAALGVRDRVDACPLRRFDKDNTAKRLKQVANRRDELRRKAREAIEKGSATRGALRGEAKQSLFKRVVEGLNLQKLLEDPNLKSKLVQAGLSAGKGRSSAFTSSASPCPSSCSG